MSVTSRSVSKHGLGQRSWRLGAATIVLGLAAFVACGEDKKSAPPVGGAAGHGGEGGSATEGFDPVRCGLATCRAVGNVAPCCANPLQGICGVELSTALEEPSSTTTCQPLTQPGNLDPGCPASTGGVIGGLPLPAFPGCCREATGQCGYLVTDFAGLLPFPPGCIDATPFLGGEEPDRCGPNNNEGGSPGAGGVPHVAGGAPNGGVASGDAGSGPQGGVPQTAGDAGAPTSAGESSSGGNDSAP
jgi:hypothetical protein